MPCNKGTAILVKRWTKRKRMMRVGMKMMKMKLVCLKKRMRIKMNQDSGVCLVWSDLWDTSSKWQNPECEDTGVYFCTGVHWLEIFLLRGREVWFGHLVLSGVPAVIGFSLLGWGVLWPPGTAWVVFGKIPLRRRLVCTPVWNNG